MKTIFLDSPGNTETLVLEPREDTLYYLDGAGDRKIALHMKEPGVRAIILSFPKNTPSATLDIIQNHVASHTESHVLIRALLGGEANFAYRGQLKVEKQAIATVADQEARALLLSPSARFQAVPSLEIRPSEVRCSHKASSAPVDENALFFLASRGIEEKEAVKILEAGFVQQAFETLSSWGASKQTIAHIQKNIL